MRKLAASNAIRMKLKRPWKEGGIGRMKQKPNRKTIHLNKAHKRKKLINTHLMLRCFDSPDFCSII